MNDKKILLIAEDEPLLLESLVEICGEIENIMILTAQNGAESLEILKTKEVDAVLSDINMPKMTGIEVLREARKLGIEVPYTILSGYGDKTNITQALALNATDFLEKPFKHDELLAVINRTLDLGRAFRALNKELDRLVAEGKIKADNLEALKKAKIAMVQMKFNNEFRTKPS